MPAGCTPETPKKNLNKNTRQNHWLFANIKQRNLAKASWKDFDLIFDTEIKLCRYLNEAQNAS